MKKEDVLKVISEVKHPAINYSLVDLGIIQDNIEVVDSTVKLVFAFPFPNIPIADALINSIALPLKSIGYDLEYKIALMTDDEKMKFMQMEAEAWKG